MNQKSIESRQAKGIRWNISMSILTFLFQLIAGFYLNKYIAREDFGKAFWALSAVSIGLMFSYFSFQTVAIRQKGVNQTHLNSIFFFSLIWNSFLFLLFFFGISQLGSKASEFSQSFIKAFSFTFLSNILALIPIVKLSRNLSFARMSSLRLVAKIISISLALYLAINGKIFWALFFLYSGIEIMYALFLSLSTKWSVGKIINFEYLKENFTLALSFVAHKFSGSLAANIDSLLVGEQYGEAELGEYYKSYGFLNLPIVNIAAPIAQVAFPSFSKLQNNRKELMKNFLDNQNLTAFLLIPIFFLLFALSQPFATLYFSEEINEWNIDRISVLLQIFSMAGAVSIFNPNFYFLFSVISSKREINTIVFGQRILLLVAICTFVWINTIFLAIGILIAKIFHLAINIWFSKKYYFRTQVRESISILIRTILISVVSAFIGYLAYNNLTLGVNPVLFFFISCLLSGSIYLLFSYLFNRKAFFLFTKIILNR